jgi:uncharacterized NAD(P)/FAD-binding protein YdhS
MSIDPDSPSQFMDWLASPRGPTLDPSDVTRKGDLFPPRSVFGDYIADSLAPMLKTGAIRHVRDEAVSVTPDSGDRGYIVELGDYSALHADILVISTSHPSPDLPAGLIALAGSDRIIANPYETDRILKIGATERILIVGSGLTSADVIASLDRRGFWGRTHTVSRHGYRGQGHGIVTWECEEDFARSAGEGVTALVRHIRRTVTEDAARGQSWHAVFDRVRADGANIWGKLDLPSRSRLLRHLRALWDVHRFRVAPQVQEVIERWTHSGILSHQAARLVNAVETKHGFDVSLRPRGSISVETRQFDWIVVTTGPAHGSVLRKTAVLSAMSETGLIAPDPLGLGLAVSDACRAIGDTGKVSERLFVAGPLARGSVGELMGLPEVTRHAQRVAKMIALMFCQHSGNLVFGGHG